MQSDRLSVEIWGAIVWLAVGLIALVLPMLRPMPMMPPTIALFETLIGLPLALWLGLLAARSLSHESWTVLGRRPVALASEPSSFWAFTGVAVLLAGVFLAGFVRGVLSLIAVA